MMASHVRLVCLIATAAVAHADDSSTDQHSAPGYVGLRIRDLSAEGHERVADSVPADSGVLVTFVAAGSPAERAGLQRFDVLVAIDGNLVREASDVARLLSAPTPGDRIGLNYARSGRRHRTVLVVGERPQLQDSSEDERGRLTRAAQRMAVRNGEDVPLAAGPVRERAIALRTGPNDGVDVTVDEGGRSWSWTATPKEKPPEGVSPAAAEDVERLLAGFEAQRKRRALRLRLQPHTNGEDRSLVVLVCQPDDGAGYRLLEIERLVAPGGEVAVDQLLENERLAGELERLSKPVRSKLEAAVRAHRPPAVQVQVRGPQ